MVTTRYEFTRWIDYESIVDTSEQVNWTVAEVFHGRAFDAARNIVPESWVRTRDLDFLRPSEQRTLNHLRAFSYAHLFGNYEEFIPLHVAAMAGHDWHDERARLRALLRFGEEEMKHQQLFRRTEAGLEAACGFTFGRYFAPDKVRVRELTEAILAYPPLPRFLLLLALEWGSQRHYVESVRNCPGDRGDSLYEEVLKHHWIEENQHVKTDVLEIARLAGAMRPDELVQAFDDFQGIAALIDATLVGQVEEEIGTLEQVTGRSFAAPERTALRDTLYQSMDAIFAGVGLTHPRFRQVALELSGKGAAKLGIA